MKAKGAQVFTNTRELAKASEFVVTMLPNNDIVTQTYEDMIKDGVNKNTLFIDSSTVDPNVSKHVQKIVSAAGASFVDAPVSGGVMGAQNATLTFMVGGTTDEYNRVKGFLEGKSKGKRELKAKIHLPITSRNGKKDHSLRNVRHGRGRKNLQQHDAGH